MCKDGTNKPRVANAIINYDNQAENLVCKLGAPEMKNWRRCIEPGTLKFGKVRWPNIFPPRIVIYFRGITFITIIFSTTRYTSSPIKCNADAGMQSNLLLKLLVSLLYRSYPSSHRDRSRPRTKFASVVLIPSRLPQHWFWTDPGIGEAWPCVDMNRQAYIRVRRH